MTVGEFVRQLERQGFRLREEDGHLVINPKQRVTPTLKETLTSRGLEIRDYLRERKARPNVGGDWSQLSLFGLDHVLEVVVPWSDIRLVLAPGCRVARELRDQDPHPGRVWCVCELADLLLSGVIPPDARAAVEARLVFDAEHAGAKRGGA